MKREQRKEATRAQASYRFWHQELRAHRFAAVDKAWSAQHVGGEIGKRAMLGAGSMWKLALIDEVEMNKARARYIELTGIAPMLF